MNRIGILPALLAFLMGVFPIVSADGQAPAPGDPDAEINQALRSREYQRAIELLDSALAAADESAREHLLFRRGLALLYDNRHQEAIARFDEQLKQFPDGAWAHKARFRKADGHVALKQFEAAERIYAERVRALVGDERKGQVAQVYLGFAEEYFEPSDTLTKPDYTKARTFYERALELEPGEELRDRISYRRALCTQKLGQWGDAAGQYEQYLLVFDDTYRELRKLRNVGLPLPPAASQPGEHLIPARVGLGECRLAAGDLIGARRAWQDLLTLLDQVDPDRRQQREPWITATYLLSKTYQLPEPPNTESLTLGVQTLEKLLRAFPGSKQAIQAAHDIAKAYAHLGRHDEAIAAYRALINREVIDPADDDTRELAETLSQDALFSIGRLYFAQKKYADAIAAWNEYVGKYPTGPHWSASQQAIVDAEYQVGADAVADERYDDARQAWTAFLQKYPLDARAPAILYMFGDLAYREQQRREHAGETPDWHEPITHWRRLVNKFPNTEQSGQAQFRIGQTFEEKIKDLEAAIEAYKKLTWSQWAEQARQRVAEMNATRLLLVTARIFRTDEPAEVRVDLRNIDRLTVKLYRIDMEDYFRKSHSLRGVEALDLLLIDPDKTLEIEVAGYAKYKPITQHLDIPFEGPGVYAVNVSNDNTKLSAPGGGPPRKLEATTLLIRSDIDVIIKSSRRQVFVFAQDMRMQAPAAGVNVLVSDGSKVLLSGKTDADGVWLGKDKKLKDLENLAVFAERDGHIAGNALSLHGLEFSTGLSPRGYIYADRPAYRPGQAVNIRGILREVKDEQYSLPTQLDDQRLRWTLDVVDAKGRVLHTEELRLSEYGSFATQFRVPEDAPVGQYKLIARRPGGPTSTGTFDVQTYQLAKAYLRFDFDEHVVMRGEPIKGSIVIQYHYGEPVAGKTVEYAMHDPFTGEEIHRSGVTDKDGKVAFEFDSTSLPEEAGVGFSARQADLGIEAGGTVYVAVRAFRAEVKTPRPLYLSEEPVEVTVETKDLKGEPLGKEMTLTAFLRTYTPDQRRQQRQAPQGAETASWADTKVTSVQVKTDAKTGRGRASLKLTKGGTYVLRAEGKDRFDHTVSAEAVVQVSDDKDKTRIRIFTDRQHYKVGEAIALDIHSRLGVTADVPSAEQNRDRDVAAGPRTGRGGPGDQNRDRQ
ncbi:MAG TPA: MG2 domain-containing protein, partial [Phycisphaerae bacterium]|nr:MG2 domain-containing protein [Phycisphaerae bacterium]